MEQSKNTTGLGAKHCEGNTPGSTCSSALRAPTAKTNPQMTNQPLHTRIKEGRNTAFASGELWSWRKDSFLWKLEALWSIR